MAQGYYRWAPTMNISFEDRLVSNINHVGLWLRSHHHLLLVAVLQRRSGIASSTLHTTGRGVACKQQGELWILQPP